jgi:hypothetical protein
MVTYNIADEEHVPDATLVTRSECAAYCRITTQSWDRLCLRGDAPKRVTPKGVRPLWRAGDVRKWYSGRTASEDQSEAGKEQP